MLGPIQAVDGDGLSLALGGRTQAALLALLSLDAPSEVDRDRIACDLWARAAPRDPDASLQVAVSRLRKVLGAEAIETGSSGYRLAIGPECIDVERFRRHTRRGRRALEDGEPRRARECLRQALAQWRGAPLADIRKFDFAVRAAEVLEEERSNVVESLMEAELAVGRHEHVVGDLAGLVEAHPLRERLWGLYMLALYRSGRQAEALRAFSKLRGFLADELGVEPTPDLVDLEERILLQDPDLELGDQPESMSGESGGEQVSFAQGDIVINEGAPSDTVYWIEEGTIEIFRAGSEGETSLAELGPGRYFGELAGLLGIRRTASARALTTVRLTTHTVEGFRRRLAQEG